MRILVLQLKRIGDVILTTPLLAALREYMPKAHLAIALDASTATLAPALDVDQVLVFQRGLKGLHFWRQLAVGRFDICLDLTGNDRSALAAAWCRAARRITWARFAKKPLRKFAYTEFVDSSVRNRHTADHHTDLLRALDIAAENVPLTLHLPQAARGEASLALGEAKIGAPFAVVHPGTARAEKYWEPEKWAKIIQFLQDDAHLSVVMTGSADPLEQAHLEAIQNALPQRCPSLAGRLSLLGTAAIIEQAQLLCAVDSAPVHFADALGTPLVALFGPTNPFHWRPRRATSRIVTAAVSGELGPDFPKAPMEKIQTRAVVEALGKLL